MHSRSLEHNNQLWVYYRSDLRIRNLSEHTVSNYFQALLDGERYFKKSFLDVTKLDMKMYLAERLGQHSATTVLINYVGLRVFFNFLVKEELLTKSPVDGISGPQFEDKPPRIPTDNEIKALLNACSGKSFRNRRDNALIRLMLEPGGPRKAEIMGLCLSGMNQEEQTFKIRGKGGKFRTIGYSNKTAQAIMRYLVLRDRHRSRESDSVWLGKYGPMSPHALRPLLNSRCRQAGIPDINPHALRHKSADRAMAAGLSDLDMLTLFGWSDPRFLGVYARANKTQRALDSARSLALGDRL